MIETYMNGMTGHCRDISEQTDIKRWFPRTCCKTHAGLDKREPGLFKIEYEGDEMIGLCSKTYIVSKVATDTTVSTRATAYNLLRKAKGPQIKRCKVKPLKMFETKFSSKGMGKRFIRDPLRIFIQVLRQRKPQSGLNHGFMLRNNTVYTYKQERKGFSYFYLSAGYSMTAFTRYP